MSGECIHLRHAQVYIVREKPSQKSIATFPYRQQQILICDAELPTRIDLAPFIAAAFVLRFNWICESLWSRVDQVFVNFDAW